MARAMPVIIGALVAAVPGFIDLHSLPSGIKRIALMHMSINLTVVAMYVVNAWLRLHGVETAGTVWLSVIAFFCCLASMPACRASPSTGCGAPSGGSRSERT